MMMFGFLPLLLIFIAFGAFRVFSRNTFNFTPRNELTKAYRTRRLNGVVFGLAKRLRGRVTLSDVVVETGMDLGEAEQYMDSLVDHAHVSVEVEEQGRLVYEFPELLTNQEEADE